MMNWDGSRGNHMMDGGWGWLGVAMMIIVTVAVVASLVWLLRSNTSGRGHRDISSDSPTDIINARYARGEIDEDQRTRMIETLS